MKNEDYELIIKKLIHSNCIDDYDNQGNYVSYIFYGPFRLFYKGKVDETLDISRESLFKQVMALANGVKDENHRDD